MSVAEKPTCPRDSGWCDGVLCRDNGIGCPNADPVCLARGDRVDPVAHSTFLGGRAWMCPTCVRTFSEAHPTLNPCCDAASGE